MMSFSSFVVFAAVCLCICECSLFSWITSKFGLSKASRNSPGNDDVFKNPKIPKKPTEHGFNSILCCSPGDDELFVVDKNYGTWLLDDVHVEFGDCDTKTMEILHRIKLMDAKKIQLSDVTVDSFEECSIVRDEGENVEVFDSEILLFKECSL